MDNNLQLLILLLKYIDSDTSIQVENKFYTYSSHPLVNAAKYMANEYLIGDDGHPDRDNIDIISSAGFPIFPGEQDRFGWVTGCIELSRGIIIFG
jgi:hypothetical protein